MRARRDDLILKQFGQAVRERREALGYSQEELAERAGIHRNYAGAVERGERNVAIVNMVRLATAMDMSLATLVKDIPGVALTSAKASASPKTPKAPSRSRRMPG